MTQKMKVLVSTLLLRDFNVKELYSNIAVGNVKVWSWGAHEYANMADKGLIFRVQGHHHKGWVLVTLDWNDVYIVHLINTDATIKQTIQGVYDDILIETIDNAVEKIADYQF